MVCPKGQPVQCCVQRASDAQRRRPSPAMSASTPWLSQAWPFHTGASDGRSGNAGPAKPRALPQASRSLASPARWRPSALCPQAGSRCPSDGHWVGSCTCGGCGLRPLSASPPWVHSWPPLTLWAWAAGLPVTLGGSATSWEFQHSESLGYFQALSPGLQGAGATGPHPGWRPRSC